MLSSWACRQDAAALIQLASTVAVVVILIAAVRFATDEASYLMTIAQAARLADPVDHYAMLLLLPARSSCRPALVAAFIPARRTAWPLVGLTPPVIYPTPSG